jgi:hypothetical protein
MNCDNYNKPFNTPSISFRDIDRYDNTESIPKDILAQLCRNEYYKSKRCNKCCHYDDLIIHNGITYSKSQTCPQKIKENNIKCLRCKTDNISSDYTYINDTAVVCHDCCDKFNSISKDLTINIINDIHDLHKCFVCKNINKNINKNTNVQDQILLCPNCSLIYNHINSKH